MTYASMTALELYDLVTRLEAHGFVLPEGLALSKNVWGNMWVLYSETPVDEQFAAAIVEVAARDWWIGLGGKFGDRPRCEVRLMNIDPESATCHINTPRHGACGPEWEGPTPLHAIVAAVEAKEAK